MKILMMSFMGIWLCGCAMQNSPTSTLTKHPQYISDTEKTIWIPRQ